MALKVSLVFLSLLLALALGQEGPEVKQRSKSTSGGKAEREEAKKGLEDEDDRKQTRRPKAKARGNSVEGWSGAVPITPGTRRRAKEGRGPNEKRREKEEQEEERGRKWVSERYEEEEEEDEQEREGRDDHPYVFEQEHFSTQVKTEHEKVSMLPKFTKRSKLLRGIENFWLGLLEVEPNTFIASSHWDADRVLFIVEGRDTITLVRVNKRHSINVEEGDIVRVEAGTPVYMINRDQNQKLVIARLLQPVNLPVHFEAFHGTGGHNHESFYTTFSWEVLEAALKTDQNKLERLFGQQQQGAIVKASREQIQALSGSEEGGRWPFGGETHGSKGSHSFNLFNKRPSHANQPGQLYIADRHDLRELEDMDVMISFANIT
ncbi:hypothetical protein NL676_012073 [Syzygium grande]|nr:hypothetical protein NL676_012073 [Syzygium grande]